MKNGHRVTRRFAMLSAILFCTAFPFILIGDYVLVTGHWAAFGIDPAGGGNIWVARIIPSQFIVMTTSTRNFPPTDNQIALLDSNGNTLWSLDGFADPHSIVVLPDSKLLVSDMGHDRVNAIDFPSGNIVWDWEPSLINWTDVNSEWGPNHYYNNPIPADWTHVNNAVWFNYTTWIGVLISLRNWDLVVEVNYTADLVDPNNPSHITWWYGDYGNHTLLYHQHSACYDANGNIWIADSVNQRVVAINYTTKAAFWFYSNNLGWVRGITPLPNNNALISCTDRVIEVTPDKQVVWAYSLGIVNALDAYRLDDGTTLIANNLGTSILLVSPSGSLLRSYGFPLILWIPSACGLPICLLPAVATFFSSTGYRRPTRRGARRLLIYEIIAISVIALMTYLIPWFQAWNLFYNNLI